MDNTFQINQLTNDISNYNSTIQANNERISRLETANAKIIENQNELSVEKSQVNQPELTTELWHGKYANDFLDKRESIKTEYNNMMNTDVEVLLDNISNAIKELKSANSDLSSLIESNQDRISKLREMEDD